MAQAERVGLDVGSFAVKVIGLSGAGKKRSFSRGSSVMQVTHAALVELDPSGEEVDAAATVAAVRKVLEDAGLSKIRRAVIGVSGPAATVRFVQMPKMEERELLSAMRLQADQYIPFDPATAVLDCQILPESETQESGTMKVLLVAAKKEVVQEKVEIGREAGVEAVAVDVDAFAAATQLADPESKESYAMVNVGARTTSVHISRAGVPQFHRDFPLGGHHLTKVLEDRFGVGYALAEALKRQHGIYEPEEGTDQAERNPEVGEAMRPVLSDLVKEIKRSFSYHEHQSYEEGIAGAVVTGGTALLPGFTSYLARELGTDVLVGDPLARMMVSPTAVGLELLNQSGAAFAVAAGLATWER
jgi:type IV pilus assembly protein PilM